MTTQKIRPDPSCKSCYGEGIVYDIVDYGSTTARLPTFCDCVENQCSNDTDDIELDLSVDKTHDPGHNPSVWKNYDALRCVNCNNVLKVPRDVDVFSCPQCNHENRFVYEEIIDGIIDQILDRKS